MSDETPDPGLTEFARSLAGFAPHAGQLDRDALLFAAGRAVGAGGRDAWRNSSALLAVLSVGLASCLAFRPANVVEVPRVVVIPAAAPKSSPPAVDYASPPVVLGPQQADWAEGMRLRQSIFRDGVAALAPPPLALAGSPEHPLSELDVPEISALNRFARP
jgi:hypothetical protein